jgi:transposase
VQTLLRENIHSQRKIAEKFNISQKLVSRMNMALNRNEDYTRSRVGKCGRKPIITPRTERKLVNLSLQNRKSTSSDLKGQLHTLGVDVSARTVRRTLF